MSKFFKDTMQGLLEAVAIDKGEIPKYKKKTKSSISKSGTKSKHKHEYKECLFIKDGRPYKGTYCTICGKIDDIGSFEIVEMDNGMCRMMNSNEVFEKYKHLEQIEIEDIFQKFVLVSKE